MKRLLALLLLSAGFVAQATAQNHVPTPILPDRLHWAGPPQIPALKAAWERRQITARAAARELHVSPDTFLRWARGG